MLRSCLSDISIIKVTAKDFKYWKDLFEEIFRVNFKTNIIYPNHCFSFKWKPRLKMSYKVFVNDINPKIQDLLPRHKTTKDLYYGLKNKQPKSKTRKEDVYNKTMFQLHAQHRVYVPDNLQNKICKKPSERVWNEYLESRYSNKVI